MPVTPPRRVEVVARADAAGAKTMLLMHRGFMSKRFDVPLMVDHPGVAASLDTNTHSSP
jgi:hypothetical protein